MIWASVPTCQEAVTMPVDQPNAAAGPVRPRRPRAAGRQDWSSWPRYNAAATGFRGYWYPVTWSSKVTGRPQAFTICGEKVVLIRDGGAAYALHDRCPHRGVPLSLGNQQFPGTLSCPYHGWTYRLSDGKLCAVITDGPDSPICGKVTVARYHVAERLGMVWIYIPLDGEEPASIDEQLPEELVTNPGNTGKPKKLNPVIAAQQFPGFASLSMPGVLRIVYPGFIHYEFYVPVDAGRHRYVGVMVNFTEGWKTLGFYGKYLGAIRWLFHGQFSGQDAWMVDVTDAPPGAAVPP
jgi:nitrite reductase/ring-hydroxylating ferredoxin subunit